jgi:hypothetical protein
MLRSILQKVSANNTDKTLKSETIKEESESILVEASHPSEKPRSSTTIDRESHTTAPLATLEFDHQLAAKRDSSIVRSYESLKFYFTYDYENGSGELYMRAGIAIFAMCGMIDRCLSLIQMTETYANNIGAIRDCDITFMVSIVNKCCSVCFIFAQSFFIFKYANLVINYRKNWLSVGLMHLVCTNFCVFFRTVVMETVAEIKHDKIDHHHAALNDHSSASH